MCGLFSEQLSSTHQEGLGRDDEFDFAIAVGHAGHSGRKTPRGRVSALAALRHVREVILEDALILGRERRFLSETTRLVRNPSDRAADCSPLAPQVGILGLVMAFRATNSD